MLPVKVAQSYSTQACGSLAEKTGFASVKGRKEKNGFVARVATRRGHFQGRHKGVYFYLIDRPKEFRGLY
jgi:hypothetical protein